jgi:signal peptidase II
LTREWRPNRHLPLLLALAGAVLVTDQVSKALIVRLFAALSTASLELLGDWLRFSFATNTGAAFGILPQQTGVFALAAAVVIPAIIYLGGTSAADPWPVRLSLGLMLGGTLGNLLDRLRLGYVVDFIDFGLGAARWPSFNVADSAFVVGTIMVASYVLFWPQAEPAREQPMNDGAPGA